MKMVQLNDLLPSDQWESNWTFYDKDNEGLPNDAEYVVFEYYCETGECDCQELIAEIIPLGNDREPDKEPLAIVKYSWSSKESSSNPTLDEQSPKNPLALHLLEVYKKFINHPEYTLRIKKDYAHIKKIGCEKQIKNINRKIGKLTNTGRNDSCPCGSNKKYKKCCLND